VHALRQSNGSGVSSWFRERPQYCLCSLLGPHHSPIPSMGHPLMIQGVWMSNTGPHRSIRTSKPWTALCFLGSSRAGTAGSVHDRLEYCLTKTMTQVQSCPLPSRARAKSRMHGVRGRKAPWWRAHGPPWPSSSWKRNRHKQGGRSSQGPDPDPGMRATVWRAPIFDLSSRGFFPRTVLNRRTASDLEPCVEWCAPKASSTELHVTCNSNGM
jgi:hypothetical protein